MDDGIPDEAAAMRIMMMCEKTVTAATEMSKTIYQHMENARATQQPSTPPAPDHSPKMKPERVVIDLTDELEPTTVE